MCLRWWAGVLLVVVVGPTLAAAQSSCTETFPQAFAADPNQLSAIGAIALIPELDNILPNPAYGVTLFAPSNDGVNSLLSTAGGAAALANLTSTLAAVILQNILPLPYSAQALVDQEGGVESLLGLYLNRTLAVVAKASGTNSSQVTVQGPVGAAVPILASFQVCASYLHVIDGALMPSESLATIPAVDPSNVNIRNLLSVPAPGAPSPPPIIYPPSPSPSPPPASGIVPVPVTATPAPAPSPTSASPTPVPSSASTTPTPASTTPTPAPTTSTPVAAVASTPTASTTPTPTPTPTAATPAPAPSGAAAALSAGWAALACLFAAGLVFAS